MDFDPFFVYYTIMTGSEDQKLNLSIWTDIRIYIYILLVYLHVFFAMHMLCIFMKYVLSESKI